jgi:hypothetical protein
MPASARAIGDAGFSATRVVPRLVRGSDAPFAFGCSAIISPSRRSARRRISIASSSRPRKTLQGWLNQRKLALAVAVKPHRQRLIVKSHRNLRGLEQPKHERDRGSSGEAPSKWKAISVSRKPDFVARRPNSITSLGGAICQSPISSAAGRHSARCLVAPFRPPEYLPKSLLAGATGPLPSSPGRRLLAERWRGFRAACKGPRCLVENI